MTVATHRLRAAASAIRSAAEERYRTPTTRQELISLAVEYGRGPGVTEAEIEQALRSTLADVWGAGTDGNP